MQLNVQHKDLALPEEFQEFKLLSLFKQETNIRTYGMLVEIYSEFGCNLLEVIILSPKPYQE
jgi:hypothetical protein